MSFTPAQAARSNANAATARATHVSRAAKPHAQETARSGAGARLGNQATQALLLGGLVQAKLSVSAPDDPREREADDVAARVMQARVVGGAPLQRKCASCEKEEIHRKRGDAAAPAPAGALAAQVDSLRGGGAPLAASARRFFEPRFGRDFSAVRIHDDARAAESARSIDALAYTHGRDIVFARGQYQPDSFAGRKLLAHELAHVVQQGEGVAAGTLQRLCGPGQIRDANGCEFPASDPATGPVDVTEGVAEENILRFNINCSDFASATEWQKARTFADSMLATDTVRVHGFASMDGDYTFNVNLSCARARMAEHALNGGGIADWQIEKIAHGPTPGPVDDRRSVILERDTPAARQPTPQLTGSVITAPDPGPCGDVYYEVAWSISRPSHAVNGGFVVQEVSISFDEADCDGNPLPWDFATPLTYFEAWRVEPGQYRFDIADDDSDAFFQRRYINGVPALGAVPATGIMTWTAVATYYDDVAALPAHMIYDNPETVAGHLRSSRLDPMLPGTPSRPVSHRLSISWDCCPDQSFPTEIGPYTPR